MKSFLAISFSLLLTATMSGWLTFVHICGAQIQSITLFPVESCETESDDTCHQDEEKPMACHDTQDKAADSCCQVEQDEDDGCCKDIQVLVKSDQPTFFAPTKVLTPFIFAQAPIKRCERQTPVVIKNTPLPENTRPPPKSVPIYIQLQRLTLYA